MPVVLAYARIAFRYIRIYDHGLLQSFYSLKHYVTCITCRYAPCSIHGERDSQSGTRLELDLLQACMAVSNPRPGTGIVFTLAYGL